jgi:hypothetical protein
MKTIFDKNTYEEINKRLNVLSSESKAQWGVMNASQMLAHCCEGLKIATGEVKRPRIFIGRILGPLFKNDFLNDKPMKKNSPTDAAFIIKDERDFNTEKERLTDAIHKFHQGGEKNATTHPHFFFGNLTPKEYGVLVYKHLDHHLKQFGV